MKAKLLTVVLILIGLFVAVNESHACPPEPPTAVLDVTPSPQFAGCTVTVDGNDSYPDANIVKYEFDFDGDGDYDYTETDSNYPDGEFDGITTWTYNEPSEYAVKLQVTDNQQLADIDTDSMVVSYFTVPGDAETIQEAINEAEDGLIIVVEPGTYEENLDFTDKEITLTSIDPDDPEVVAATIIDGGDANNVIVFDLGDANSTITGFTITNGNAYYGGGIFCGNVSPTITNCNITGNAAETLGGGIYSWDDSYITITNCIFSNNTSDEGGGIFTGDGGHSVMTNCVFYENTGGGAHCHYGSQELTNCVFTENSYGVLTDVGNAVIKNCIFWGNGSCEISNSWNQGGSYSHVSYSDIEGGINGSKSCGDDSTDDGDNIDDNPQFLDSEDPDGDDDTFRTADDGLCVDIESPCIDAGSNNDVPADVDTDIIGNDRIVDGDDVDGAVVDMGAYEVSGLIGYWKFNESSGTTADDSYYNDNDGTLNNFPGDNSQWIDGVADGALEFDGTNDYVNIFSPGDYSTNSNFTWLAWIRTSSGGVVLAKTPSASATGVKALYVDDSDGKLKFTVGGVDTTSSAQRVDDGLWHQVAVSVQFETSGSDDTVTLYIDGDSDTEDDDWNVTYDESSYSLKIGYANSGFTTEGYFDGKIDDVRIYNKALPEAQIQSFFDAPDYWRFVATGDSRGTDTYEINAAILAEMATAVIAEKAEVWMFPGDLVTNGSQSNFQGWKDTIANVYNAGITVMPIRGNHEISGGGDTPDWVAVFGGDIPDNGPVGETNLTYYVTNENAVFIALDLYIGDTLLHYVNQNWLDTVLTTEKHVFVATHEPAFEVDHTDCLDDQLTKRNTFWESLEDEAGCRLYFCGHDHFYNHARLDDGDQDPDDDVHQMLVGSAGAPLRNWDETYSGSNGSWTPTLVKHRGGSGTSYYGYVVVEVWGDNVTSHWKVRNAANSYLPDGDVFEYSVP